MLLTCRERSGLATLAHLAATSMAQQSLSSRLMPITAPIQNLGVYRVATGTWTRNATFANDVARARPADRMRHDRD